MIKEVITLLFLIVFIVGCAVSQQSNPQAEVTTMKLTSPAFSAGEKIPPKYTCDGGNISPPLKFEQVPANAGSLVLIMDDPDIPEEVRQSRGINVFDHLVLFNIAPTTDSIKENSSVGIPGKNGRGDNKYTGPCPPPQYQPQEHRYFFKLYALDTTLNLKEGATKAEVEQAMQGHIIAQAELMGRYERS